MANCNGRKWMGFSRTIWCVREAGHEGWCRTYSGNEFEPREGSK